MLDAQHLLKLVSAKLLIRKLPKKLNLTMLRKTKLLCLTKFHFSNLSFRRLMSELISLMVTVRITFRRCR